MLLRFNGDGSAIYHYQTLSGAGATASAARTTADTSGTLFDYPSGTSQFGGGMILIPHYAGTANHKIALAIGGNVENSVQASIVRYASTSAITTVTLIRSSGNFVANSIFLLCAVDERYLVEESNLSTDGTVTFSAIPQTPGDLVAIGYCRTDRAATSDDIDISANADTTDGNYARQRLSGANATAAAAAASDRAMIEGVPGDSATANVFGTFIVSVSQHANGVKQPHILVASGYHETSGPTSNVAVASGRRANIAAYTSVAFNPGAGGTNFKSGSLFSLYHVPKRLVAYKKLTADAASITHTVPSGFESLTDGVFSRTDQAAIDDYGLLQFNSDTTESNYDVQSLYGNNATVTAATSAAQFPRFSLPGANEVANIFSGGVILIPAYVETDRHKHALAVSGLPSPTAANSYVIIRSHRWESIAALATIDVKPSAGNLKGS